MRLKLRAHNVTIGKLNVVSTEESFQVVVTELGVMDCVASSLLNLVQVILAHELVSDLEAVTVGKSMIKVHAWLADQLIHVIVKAAVWWGMLMGHHMVYWLHVVRWANSPSILNDALSEEECNSLLLTDIDVVGNSHATLSPKLFKLIHAEPLMQSIGE